MTARTRTIRKSARPRVGKYIFLGFLALAVALAVALVSAGIATAKSWLEDLPDYSDTDAYLLAEPTKVLDAKGNTIAEFYAENRIPVTIDEVNDYVLEGTVDIEDERFYTHNGVDLQGILRAVVVQFTGGSEGASTITQQLVRNTVLKNEQWEKTLSRKVREAYIAVQLEKMYSKDQILMMYLNTIYYGSGCYGIEAASETYFNKPAKDLTLVEAATLVGLPQSPTAYDPTSNPDLAVERRNLVLGNMLRNGDISQQEYDDAVATPLELDYHKRADSGAYEYPYFVSYVQTQLKEQFSSDTIFKGGLTIKTTIDPDTQAAAETARTNVLTEGPDGDVNAAIVAIEPNTGYIRAMVGGWGYDYSQYNLATQAKRQPGSSFKTITLAAAVQAGLNPLTLINSNSGYVSPVDGNTYNNINGESWGTITLKQATQWSSNTAYIQVTEAIGVDAVVQMAQAMGITSELYPSLNLTLGTSETTVLEMADAYATLASGGVHHTPTAITEVDDRNGNPIYTADTTGDQVLTPEVAKAVTSVLEGVINDTSDYSRTGASAALSVDQPVAGKTGTTDDRADLWFCGYTPQLACAVWVGNPDTRSAVYYNGVTGTTETLPNPIFKQFMDAALAGMPREEWSFANAGDPNYTYGWSFSQGVGSATSAYYSSEETSTDASSQQTTNDASTTTSGTDASANNTTTGTSDASTTPTTPSTDASGADTGAGAGGDTSGAGAGTGDTGTTTTTPAEG